MKTILIFILLLTSISTLAEVKTWKFFGGIHYKNNEFELILKKGVDSDTLTFKGVAHRSCLVCALEYFEEEHNLAYDKDLILNLESLGGGNTAFHSFMAKLANKCESNLPNNEYPSYLKEQFERMIEKENSRDAKKCRLITKVGSKNKCASFCTVLFLMGIERIAYQDSLFGFHKSSGNLIIETSDLYSSFGVNRDWLTKNEKLFSTTKMTYLKPQRLHNSNILTNVKD